MKHTTLKQDLTPQLEIQISCLEPFFHNNSLFRQHNRTLEIIFDRNKHGLLIATSFFLPNL
jgi:hypothetical protein